MNKLHLDMKPQPDDTTCGPTCLHAVYRYFDDPVSLNQLISEIPVLEGGGTLNVYLACHALRRGYKTTIYTYNLKLFDPTWFTPHFPVNISEKLMCQLGYKTDSAILESATYAYIEFLNLGGKLCFEDLTPALIRKYLKKSVPILTGLNSTYLYNCAREYSFDYKLFFDDIRGESTGHFVVLSGYDKNTRKVHIDDPFLRNPLSSDQHYEVNIYRLICSIMLGIVSYDANLLIIEPLKDRTGKARKRNL